MRRTLIVALAAMTIAVAGWASYRLALEASLSRVDSEASDRLTLIANTFDATVARFRYLPTVLSLEEPIRDLYRSPRDARSIAAANRYLKSLNRAAGSAELFVLDEAGVALAASNFDQDTSFVGHNYAFRSYFQDALRAGEGHIYAVGATTGLPGYFLSHRVVEGDRTLGVTVVKIDLSALEADWARAGDVVAVEDGNGVIFLSSRERWKYHPLEPLPVATIAQLNETRQFGSAIESSPVLAVERRTGNARIGRAGEPGWPDVREYAVHTRQLTAHGWQLLVFSDVDDVRRYASTVSSAATLAAVAGLLIVLVAYQRRQVMRAKLEAHDELERRVTERTAELSAVNAKLSTEVEERIRAEQGLRQTQESLIQSAKLASLGQALAGVAHEINQPLAALNTYVASSRILLRRNELERAAANLDLMSSIAERMMALIEHLRMFARKETGARSPVDLPVVIGNAMRLVEYRIRNEGIKVDMSMPSAPVYVMANPVRLEQVLVNLLSNAIDAMHDTEQRLLGIVLDWDGERAVIEVSDTGHGIAPEHVKSLFDPFFTTKDIGQGLGLGLSISYGIIRECGGDIMVESAPRAGARFRVVLPTMSPADARQPSGLHA